MVQEEQYLLEWITVGPHCGNELGLIERLVEPAALGIQQDAYTGRGSAAYRLTQCCPKRGVAATVVLAKNAVLQALRERVALLRRRGLEPWVGSPTKRLSHPGGVAV